MATCTWCHNDMLTGVSCVVDAFHRDSRRFEMTRFGDDPDSPHAGDRCGDCGVLHGGWHHPGCDLQRCPECRRRLMSCGCRFDEDGPDEDEDVGLVLVEPLGVDGNGLLTERMRLGDQEVVVHFDDVPETDVTIVDGIPVTTALRTVIDIAVIDRDAFRRWQAGSENRAPFD